MGQVRTNFSLQHLMAAAKLAREVRRIEEANRGSAFGPFFEDVLGASVGCVLLAVAGSEAYINEIFVDRAKYFTDRDKVLLDLWWREFEQKRPIDKYDLAVRLSTGGPLDEGSATVQSLDRLSRLRNALTHFKPEWPNEAVDHEKLGAKIEGYVVRSPWFPKENLFPRAWASHGTSKWAVSTVISFITEFSQTSGIQNRLEKHVTRLCPE
jgi:hypothetical protein